VHPYCCQRSCQTKGASVDDDEEPETEDTEAPADLAILKHAREIVGSNTFLRPEIIEALKDFKPGDLRSGIGAGLLGTDLRTITEAAKANQRRWAHVAEAAKKLGEEREPIFRGPLPPPPEQLYLQAISEQIGQLRQITAGQADNVALQAAMAEVQGGKLDQLITAINTATATTERLEQTAIRVAVIAIVVAMVQYLPGIADYLRPIVFR